MSTGKKKYYAEFIGAHGAGKTFTYHAITKQHLLKPYKAVFPSQLKRPRLHFALSCPLIALKNIRHIIFVISFFFQYAQMRQINFKVFRALFKMIILHKYCYRFDFDVLLKDDMLHMLQRIMFKKNVQMQKAFSLYFMHFVYLYDGLIFVDINREEMNKRFKLRFIGKSVAFIKSREVIHERARKQSEILRKVVISQKIVPCLVLDGSADVNENAQKVVKFVKQKMIKI